MADHPPSLYSLSSSHGFLSGKLLLATPNMQDERFNKAVILLCEHNKKGAMGIILNKPMPNVRIGELIKQFNLHTDLNTAAEPIFFGGPVDTTRGFVLHTDEYVSNETTSIFPSVNLTATLDVVRNIAQNKGPKKRLMALGYAGWTGGQLEDEIRDNAWLVAEGNQNILFDTPTEDQWSSAYHSVGLDPLRFANVTGSA